MLSSLMVDASHIGYDWGGAADVLECSPSADFWWSLSGDFVRMIHVGRTTKNVTVNVLLDLKYTPA